MSMGYDIESELHRVFVENVRARRAELGLTQEQAAQNMGISQPSWAQIEHGRTKPNLAVVERVAAVLRTTPSQLLMANAFAAS